MLSSEKQMFFFIKKIFMASSQPDENIKKRIEYWK